MVVEGLGFFAYWGGYFTFENTRSLDSRNVLLLMTWNSCTHKYTHTHTCILFFSCSASGSHKQELHYCTAELRRSCRHNPFIPFSPETRGSREEHAGDCSMALHWSPSRKKSPFTP